MESVIGWIRSHDVLLWWLSALSVLMFFGSLLIVPWLAIRIPADYFVHHQQIADRWRSRHPLVRAALFAVKNVCGLVLVLTGIPMLVLPGQGVLTILIGLMCLDFPGKFTLERWLVLQPAVRNVIQWMRRKANRPPLELQ